MARTNFQYEKRQRELEKKRKAEEKARKKAEAKHQPTEGGEGQADGLATTEEASAPEGEEQG
jgi:hypothetical protein